MRLAELHLDRFGCFTDRRLAFRSDAAVTVVYGPNEAGKSTALAAIADVLYGIEARSPFDFLHRYTDMRLGATVAGPDGQQLVFRRRKGNQNTLLGPDDTPLPDDVLAPFLGSVDRALFLEAFGLDRDSLRAGARRLIEGGGRVGESLLAAAPGLSSLIALRASLAAEAEQLFPAGRKVSSRPFWQACERHAEARRRVRQESLQADTVRAARSGLEEARAAVERLKQQQRAVRQELSRLGRLKAALPRLGRIDALEAERAGLGALPEVDGDFTGRCRAALETRRELVSEAQRLDAEIAEAKARLEGLAVDDALLTEAEAVDSLSDQRAAILKADEDRPKREGELAAVRQQLDELARRLGLADRDALLARRPADAEVARARSLLAQRQRLRDQRQERSETLKRVAAEIDELARRREKLGHLADPVPIRQQLDGFAVLGERVVARDELARSLSARQAELEDAVQRLVVPVASADDLARLPVPDAASVEQAIERCDGLERRRDEVASEAQRLEAHKRRIEQRIVELAAEGEVPTAEAVNEARRVRDELWQALRPRLQGDPPAAEQMDAYEAAVSHADQLADRRQADADRVAVFRALESERGEVEAGLASTEQELARLDTEAQRFQETWTDLWLPARLTPSDPREMRGWLQARADVLELRSAIAAERARLADADARIGEAADRLRALAENLGVADAGGGPAELLKAVTAAVGEMETRFQDARLIAQQRESCEAQQRALATALAELEEQEADWRGAWREASEPIGIREQALDDEAEAALAAWQAVPALAASLGDLEHRVGRMRQDREAFEAAVVKLCRAVAKDLAATPPLQAVAMLRERLVAARQAATRRDAIQSTLAGLEEKRNEVGRHEQLNERAVAELCEHAGAEPESLAGLAQAIEHGVELARQLADERKALLAAADGLGETELRGDLAGRDPDELAARIQELEDAQVALDDSLSTATASQARAEAELDRIEAHAGAAAAAQDEQNALAELADIIETWSGLAAAERLLAATIEAYRAQHQNPLLERASQAFATATGGAFTGLSLDYDEADTHRIVAVRPDGARLAVEALSEGTADQLFLALRIATIEDHARRARPLPFIADDLFVTFDDTRTKAGLRLLAELGRTTQVIVFTHHQHVVEAARHALGAEVDTIDLG